MEMKKKSMYLCNAALALVAVIICPAKSEEAITFNGVPQVDQVLRQDRFENPPIQFQPIALWRLIGEHTPKNVQQQIRHFKKAGFGSIPARNDVIELRDVMITTARDLGMLVMHRDGRGFPSGGPAVW